MAATRVKVTTKEEALRLYRAGLLRLFAPPFVDFAWEERFGEPEEYTVGTTYLYYWADGEDDNGIS